MKTENGEEIKTSLTFLLVTKSKKQKKNYIIILYNKHYSISKIVSVSATMGIQR